MVSVQVRFLNGDEALLSKCRTIDDARVKCAALHDLLAPEVVFLSPNENTIMEKLSQDELPALPLSVIFQVTEVYTAELLLAAVLLHAQSGDRKGVIRAMGHCSTDNDAQFLCARALLFYLRTEEHCSADVVELLCSCPISNAINVEDEMLWTSLDVACFQNADSEIIRILLDARVDIRHTDSHGRTALSRSALQGNLAIVEMLLEKDDRAPGSRAVNITDSTGFSPLCLAAIKGHASIATALLQHKARVNYAGRSLMTALHQASCSGHSDVVQILLGQAADTSIVARSGRTPLIMAAAEGHVEVCQLLLKYGADVHFTIDGCNALGFATLRYNADLCKLLLENGANVNVVLGMGTPLIIASRQKRGFKVVEVLLRAKADVTMCNSHGWEALCVAVKYGNLDVARKLWNHGARCNAARRRASHDGHELEYT